MTFLRFEHINLACHDLNQTLAFYQTLFPAWEVRAEGVYEGRRWVHFGNHQFYLAFNDTPELSRTHHLYENIGINHVGFVIDDGDAMKAHLEAHSIDYYTLTAPETKHRIYVTDPDGNEVELVEYQASYEFR